MYKNEAMKFKKAMLFKKMTSKIIWFWGESFKSKFFDGNKYNYVQ